MADSSGITPGSGIGDVGDQRLDVAEFGVLFEGRSAEAQSRVLEGEAAVEAGLVDRFSPTLVEHVGELDQVEVREGEGRRRRDAPRAGAAGSLLQAPPADTADAHRGEPLGGLPVVGARAGSVASSSSSPPA
ncbi:MAG: hypothetical protein V9E94_15350 [Microthrixaceae bacterium]